MNKTATEFDDYADDYQQALAKGVSLTGESADYFASARAGHTQQMLNRQSISVICDFGCGTGGTIEYLCSTFQPQKVIGTDVSAKSLALARARFAGTNIEFRELEGYHPTAEFDLVYTNGVFHHIPIDQRLTTAQWIHQALVPGGTLAFWENNPWNPGTRMVMRRIPFDRDAITLSIRQSTKLLADAGFEILCRQSYFYFPRSLAIFRGLERYLRRMPLGGQYLLLARKP